MNVPQIAPIRREARNRQSSDNAWPLRRADGTRWCDERERKQGETRP